MQVLMCHDEHHAGTGAFNTGLILKLLLQVCHGGPAHPDCGVSTQVVSRRTVVLYCKD